MYCDKCGKEIKPEWKNCPGCGAALHGNAGGTDWSNVSGGSGNEFVVNNMKWYQFIIYVQLFLAAIFKGIEGIRTMTGKQYGDDKNLYYLFYGSGLKMMDILYGILCIGFAVVAILVRQLLAKKKVNASNYYLLYSGMTAVAALGYAILFFIFTRESAQIVSAVISLIVSGIYIALNYVYFQKRRHLFVN